MDLRTSAVLIPMGLAAGAAPHTAQERARSCAAAAPAAAGLFVAGGGWRIARIPLRCLREAGADVSMIDQPFALTAPGRFAVAVADLCPSTDPEGSTCPK